MRPLAVRKYCARFMTTPNFGVNTLPEYRRQGVAAALLERAIFDAKAQGRKGLVLTCKDKLVHYYAKFGFVSEGVSGSTHGGVL